MATVDPFKYITPEAATELRRELRTAVEAAARAAGIDPATVRVSLYPNADTVSVEIRCAGATHEQFDMMAQLLSRTTWSLQSTGDTMCIVRSAVLKGLAYVPVTVSAELGEGFGGVTIEGLPAPFSKYASTRVASSIANLTGATATQTVRVSITPSLGPEFYPEGLDLPIALAVLTAIGKMHPIALPDAAFGSLSFSGRVESFRGLLPLLRGAKNAGAKSVFAPANEFRSNGTVEGLRVGLVGTLNEAKLYAEGFPFSPIYSALGRAEEKSYAADLACVACEPAAARALLIAAVGQLGLHLRGDYGHGVSPTVLARTLTAILPDLSEEQAMEARCLYSLAGLGASQSGAPRPAFRAPHFTASPEGLTGQHRPQMPGEVSLAHGGVLYLDNGPEFTRASLQAVQTALEYGVTDHTARLPANFQPVVSSRLCSCVTRCACGPEKRNRYLSRLPLRFRAALDVTVTLGDGPHAPLPYTAEEAHVQIMAARARLATYLMIESYEGGRRFWRPSKDAFEPDAWKDHVVRTTGKSANYCASLGRVAASIAALADASKIRLEHVEEAALFVVDPLAVY